MQSAYNTLSRSKKELKPRKGKKLHIFVCGPTVYDLSHIGHARTYIAFDMIVKYLKYAGYDVYYLQNITDIDDKIIQRAAEEGKPPLVLAREFEKEYMADMKTLGITAVSKYARATDHMKEIIKQVKQLLEKEYAYEIADDGIYFDIAKFKEYGKLSHRTTQQAQDAVSRIDESVSKRNKGDFALWKFSPSTSSGQETPEPKWKSPWGEGRPGWHIEDTAITEKQFGPQYDIHGGAQDLIFPHHEAEITQMESISGKEPLVNYWMHTGFLTVQGEKMSKSLGNFITIRDFLENHSARLLRFLILKSHYRSPIDYSEKALEQARSELARIDEFVDRLWDTKKDVSIAVPDIKKAMDDDFNTSAAIAVLFEFIREANAKEAYTKKTLNFLKEIDTYFGFIFWGREKLEVPVEIKKLGELREQYRKEKNWEKSDEVRDELRGKGWVVEDTSSGPKLKKLK